MYFNKYETNYGVFELTEEQKEEKRIIQNRNAELRRQLIDKHVKDNNLIPLNNAYLGMDSFYYDKKENKIYAISYNGSTTNIEYKNISYDVAQHLKEYNPSILQEYTYANLKKYNPFRLDEY